MEFRPLKSEDLLSYEELPKYVYMGLSKDTIGWGGFDEAGSMVSFVAFSPDPVDRTRAFLDYIHVREDLRGKGLGTETLKFVELQLLSNRVLSIYIKTVNEMDKRQQVYDFLVKNEYVPTVLNATLLEYKVEDVHAEQLLKSYSKPLQNKLNIQSFDEIEPFLRKKVLAICWANKMSVTEQVINSAYTMIKDKAKVDGFLAVQRINEEMLYVWDSFLRDPKTRNITFLSMLAATVDKALKDGKINPSGNVIITAPEINLAEGVIKYLGKPTDQKSQQEFSKLLRR